MPNSHNNKSDILLEKLNALKKEKNAVILSHNYQIDEVQDIADYVGDSLDLSRLAAKVEEEVIVFCGVDFMAESAAILAPGKTVLLPDPLAGCPLADMATADQIREAREKHPGAQVVTYINSSAAVKAESDVCVTSSNALQVVQALGDGPIIFAPDMNLGHYVSLQAGKEMILWDGYCITHHRVTSDDIDEARKVHPGAPVVVHPECRPEVVAKADYVLSTGGMVKEISRMKNTDIILGTEMGMIHRLKKENPDKNFYLLSSGLICPNMKYNTLEKVVSSLENMETVISVPEGIRGKAALALERMLELSI